MKNWCIKLLLSIVILLNGHGVVYAHAADSKINNFSFSFIFKTEFSGEYHLKKGRTFESFKRKMCLFDNEENEDNFSAAQKQPVKGSYFSIFHCSNLFTIAETAFTKKVNDCKIFSLLYNKVYLLFQVFRI